MNATTRRAIVVWLLVAPTTSLATTPAYADCAQGERIAGECSAVYTSSDGEQVSIQRESSREGSAGAQDIDEREESTQSADTSASAPVGSGGAGGVSRQPAPIRLEAQLGSTECDIRLTGLCRGQAPPKDLPASTTEASASSTLTPPTPPRYASELRNFRPRSPDIILEPGDWSLPTLPMNTVAIASRHTVRGELLGWPVRVRFTPVAYHWSFGDGSGISRGAAGATWSTLGLRQFDSTATSHRYAKPGRYQVGLRVDYRVEFRFDDGEYDDIEGLVSASAPGKSVRVLSVSPLLVER